MPDIYEGNNRRITSTSQAAKGSILFGKSSYNEAEDVLDIAGTIKAESITLTDGKSDGYVLIAMQRNSAPASPGGDLSLSAGSPRVGETDQDGGDLVLSTGSSTGTGTAKVQVKAAPPGTTGTDDNAPVVALEVRGDGNVLAGPQAGVAQDAASGFLCIPIIATGDPTGSPASIPAGMAAIGYVAATGKLAVWDGSAWKLITVDA
jgi:hypothetical protein